MFDNRGAHCACAAPRARPSPAPPERTRRPGARRSRSHAALRGRWDTRPGKWAVGRGLATRRRRGGCALRAGLLPQRPPPLVFIFLELGSFLPPSLPFAVRGKASEGARGHLESLLFFVLVTTGSPEEILPPSLEAWNLHRQGFLLHVSCLCCADGNFRNMPPSRRGRERLAQSSEAPMVSELPGPRAVDLGFPLSARGSCVPP